MATPYRILIPVNDTGLLKWQQHDETAAKISELLQKDLESHHAFVNERGFHNHILHHLLCLYGTGASPEALETAYAANASRQIKALKPRPSVVEGLQRGWGKDCAYLGQRDRYADFLVFFQREIRDKGWRGVVEEYVFRGDERADDMLGRLFAGLLHPLIQLMYGLEWHQPAIIAAALAQTATHDNRFGSLLLAVEEAAASHSKPSSRLAIPELYETVLLDGTITAPSTRWYEEDDDDGKKIYDTIFSQAMDVLMRVRVEPEELDERLAEMLHSCAYVAAATAFHPPNIPKIDFFLLHHLTSSPFFLTLSTLPWLPPSTKARILEWKIRLDIVQYIATGCPPLQPQALKSFTPTLSPDDATAAAVSQPEALIPRFHRIVDDGHTIKAARALLLAQGASRRFAGRPWIRIPDDETWLKVHYLLVQGVEGQDDYWVRSAGFDEAWREIPETK